MSRSRGKRTDRDLAALLDACDQLEHRSSDVLTWARDGRHEAPAPARPVVTAPPVAPPRPVRRSRTAAEPGPRALEPPRHEAELAPAVTGFLEQRGLVVGREFSVYPSRRSRRRTVADLVAIAPSREAVGARMKAERRRVTVAEFWPALLQSLELAPDGPFRRADLLARLEAHPLTRGMPPARLSRYLRTLRRYGYLKRCDRTHYLRRRSYLPVADPHRTVAVELKRKSFRAGAAQALSYAKVVPTVWIATGGRWPADPGLESWLRNHGIGALQVQGATVRERLAPVPGLALDPRCQPYRLVLEERVVREQVLGRPRAFA